jgi:hypothetical protein
MKKVSSWLSKWKVILTLFMFLFAVSNVFAQDEGGDLEETLQKLSESAAKGYITPIVSAFGSNLNGGWFHSAPPPTKFGLKLEFGLVGMGTFFPEEQTYRHFSTSGTFRFDQSQATQIVQNSGLGLPALVEDALIDQMTQQDFTVGIEGATIIGASDDDIIISFSGGDVTFTDPGTGLPRTETLVAYDVDLGFGGLGDFLPEVSFLPFLAPQASIGTVLGTRAVFRYIPEVDIPGVSITEDIGKFSWFGWGVQHNPGVFFPNPLPLDVSIGFFKQTLKVGTVLEANTTAYGLTVSKKLGVGLFNITPYAGYLIEKSTLHFAYDFTLDPGDPIYEQTIPIDFELEGENNSRITVGLSMKLLMFNINADYNMGNYNSVTVGIMFGI